MLGAVCLVVVLPLGIQHFVARSEYALDAATLEAQQARARELKVPLTWADLDPNLPPDQNAAPIYLEAIAMFKKLPAGTEAGLYSMGVSATSMGTDSLSSCSHVLPLLKRAAIVPHCFFERDSTKEQIPDGFWDLKKLVKIACAQAMWDAHEGRMEAAIQWVSVAAKLSHHAGEDPSSGGFFLQSALEAIVFKTLQRVITSAQMTPKDISQARAVIATMGGNPLQAMAGDLVLRLNIYGKVDEYFEQPSETSLWRRILELFGGSSREEFDHRSFYPFAQDPELVERAYQARVLSRWIPFFEAARSVRSDPVQIARAISDLDAAVQRGTHRIDRAERQFPGLEALSEMSKRDAATSRKVLQDIEKVEKQLGR